MILLASRNRGEASAEILRWGVAGCVVALAHAGAIAGYVLLRQPPALAAGAPVVLVEMAAAPAAPQIESLDLPLDQPQQEAKPEPQDITPPLEPPPQVTATVPLPEPTPPKPKIQPKKPPAPKTVATASAPSRAETVSAAPLGVSAAETRAAHESWGMRVSAHLQRHKRYPAEAQARREQGVVRLGFTVDRNGHVLGRHIVRSSGSRALDDEALALVLRAQPLPTFPPAMTQAREDVTVPLEFSTR